MIEPVMSPALEDLFTKQFRGDTTYAANAVNLNETDEWLGLQGATTRLDLGTKTLAWCGWVDWDGSSRHVLF